MEPSKLLSMSRQQRKAEKRRARRKGIKMAEPGNASPSDVIVSGGPAENPGLGLQEGSVLGLQQGSGSGLVLQQTAPEKGEEIGKQKKKEKSKVKHPTELPPSDLNLDTFQLKHPFVKLRQISSIWKDDRCSEVLEMDFDTMKEFLKLLAPLVIKYPEVYSCDGEELAVRPLHAAILFLFGRLAKTLAEISDVDDEGEDREGIRIYVPAGDEEGDDEDDDTEVDAASKVSSGSSREGAVVTHERASSRVRADFVAQAYDKAYIRTKQLSRFSELALCTFLVVEPKGNDLPKGWQKGVGGAALQAAAYCIIEALKNRLKGRKKPINFQGWSMYHWAYGELYVDKVVKLIDGCVHRVTEDGHLEADATLQAILLAQQVKLQDHLGDIHADYPNGDYLVGTVYTSREVLQFPTSTSLKMPHVDIFRFVQGLLHLFLGKKVLKWKVDDAKRLIAAMVADDAKIQDEVCLLMERNVYENMQRGKRLRV